MHPLRIHILILLLIGALINPSPLMASEQRTALVIGNSTYSSGPLKNPVNDATDIAAALKRAGFNVTLKRNANLQEMVETIEAFGNSLKRGGVGLFYYAGHGVQVNGVNYLLPVNARINKESDVRFQAVDAGRILAEMEYANNGLNIVILDACRDNPFSKSFRSASRGLAIVTNAPSGTFISYSTGAGQVANDGTGRNSPYTAALLENITKPGLSINKVFMNVRSKVKKETGQVPWELSSLEGEFYFLPGSGKKETEGKESVAGKTSLQDELEAEREKLRQERELFEQRKALEEEKRKLEEEKKQLALVKHPPINLRNEIRRDGRFIAYDNGTVLDTRTNLMWAAGDNGSDISWENAKTYCHNYRAGGYTDWRMPTHDELAGLYNYNTARARAAACKTEYNIYIVTDLIDITCFNHWGAGMRGTEGANFGFVGGERRWYDTSLSGTSRVIPVRYAR
ncbi:MAG TPA: caspase family protein [Smithellaceae bacterium]|nr:caspase family protein [Smithellaceae bacterium]